MIRSMRAVYEIFKAIGVAMALGAALCALLYLSIYVIVVLICVGVPLLIIVKYRRDRRRGRAGWWI